MWFRHKKHLILAGKRSCFGLSATNQLENGPDISSKISRYVAANLAKKCPAILTQIQIVVANMAVKCPSFQLLGFGSTYMAGHYLSVSLKCRHLDTNIWPWHGVKNILFVTTEFLDVSLKISTGFTLTNSIYWHECQLMCMSCECDVTLVGENLIRIIYTHLLMYQWFVEMWNVNILFVEPR